jgi:magnesium chelatase accessory protein
MANWDLGALAEDLPRLRVPLQLIVGSQDLTVSPAHSDRAMRSVAPEYRRPVIQLQGLGHLAHEEQAPRVAQELLSHWHAP